MSCSHCVGQTDHEPNPYVINIEQTAIQNQNFRTAVWTEISSALQKRSIIGVMSMAVSYKKLWKLLIDRDMRKKDLCAAAGISHA